MNRIPHFDFGEVDALIHDQWVEWEAAADVQVETDETPVFTPNAKQCALMAAAKSGDFDTIVAAGTIYSSKTYGIVGVIVELCQQYPGLEVLVVRAKWDDLLSNTIPDFKDVLGYLPAGAYEWPQMLLCEFPNGSRIKFRPARERQDKRFSWLKGMKFDIAFADEHDHLSPEFVSMLQSRVGLRRRSVKGIKYPRLAFFACNPNISHPKDMYSTHLNNNALLIARRIFFLLFTIDDNAEFIGQAKLDQWKRTMTPAMFKCFVGGSWDAMSEKEQLYTYDYMDQCAELIPPDLDEAGNERPWKYYLGVDPAFYGDDKCTFFIQHGPNLFRVDWFDKSSEPEIIDHIRILMSTFEITPDHVTIDVGGGYGAGVAQQLAKLGIFINQFNGAEAVVDEYELYTFTFLNKRARAHWEFMMAMRDKKVGGLSKLGWKNELNVSEVLRQDLAAIHYGFADRSKAIKIEGKPEIKKRLGRSPDFSDGEILCWLSYLADAKKPSMEIIG